VASYGAQTPFACAQQQFDCAGARDEAPACSPTGDAIRERSRDVRERGLRVREQSRLGSRGVLTKGLRLSQERHRQRGRFDGGEARRRRRSLNPKARLPAARAHRRARPRPNINLWRETRWPIVALEPRRVSRPRLEGASVLRRCGPGSANRDPGSRECGREGYDAWQRMLESQGSGPGKGRRKEEEEEEEEEEPPPGPLASTSAILFPF
jgi:hypothetical protein